MLYYGVVVVFLLSFNFFRLVVAVVFVISKYLKRRRR